MITTRRGARWAALVSLAGLGLAACSSATTGTDEPGASIPSPGAATVSPTPTASPAVPSAAPTPTELPQIPASPWEEGPSALDLPTPDDLVETAIIESTDFMSGGPPPDGIPSIDAPRFVKARSVTTLTDTEPVLSLEVGGETRAYPVRILIWHEIVNDTIDGVPVAVTYCPLCNSALAFDRRLDDRVLSFGTSGLLYNSDLVMYDRQTQSLWPQLSGLASIGRLTGAQLDRLPIQTVAWADFKEAHPDAWVLSEDTGYDRNYGSNPYVRYDEEDSQPFAFLALAPKALPVKARVIGLGSGEEAVAITLDRLRDEGVMQVSVDGVDVVLFFDPGLTSALDTESLAEARAVGATGAFSPNVDGQRLTFTATDMGFTDAETGSSWNVLGQATSGPLTGTSLERIDHVDTFWFAWSAFQPETSVVK